jgi:hypothetical protein
MNATDTDSTSPVTKTTKRQVRKQSSPVDDQKVKTAISLSAKAYRQLGITAVLQNTTQSTLIEQWIWDNCKRYVVHDRGNTSDRLICSDAVNPAA